MNVSINVNKLALAFVVKSSSSSLLATFSSSRSFAALLSNILALAH